MDCPDLPPVLAEPPQHRGRDRIVAMVRGHRAIGIWIAALAVPVVLIVGLAVLIVFLQAAADNPCGPDEHPEHCGIGVGGSAPPSPSGLPSGSGNVPAPRTVGQSGLDSVAYSPGGTTLAVGDQSGSTDLWDAASGRRLATFTDPVSWGSVSAVAFSPAGTVLAAGDVAGSTYLWSVASGRLLATLTDESSPSFPAGSFAEGFGVEAVAFSPDGTVLAAGDANGGTYLWSVASGQLLTTVTDPGSLGVNSVAFSPDGKTLAVGDDDGWTYLWSVATGRRLATLTDPGGQGEAAVAFSPRGTDLAVGDSDGSTYLWDIATRKVLATFSDPGGQGVDAVAFGRRGTVLAAGDGDGSTYLWNVASGQLKATLSDAGKGGQVYSVAFSPDSRTLAVGDGNIGKVFLWNLGKLSLN